MNKRILILILNSGEGELNDSLEMLKNQTYKNWSKVIFSNLPNKEAHDTLYGYIMDHKDKYDLFVKLDADMVLFNNQSLELIVNYFEKNPNMDQGNFAVYDNMSGQNIMGLLVFTNKAKWKGSDEKLFVDYAPTIPGKRLLIWDKPAPVAIHCPNPRLFQAFHYGAHRAMKAIQKDREKKNLIQSAIQWHLLFRVWQYFKKTKDAKRGMMMLGAYLVWKEDIDDSANEYNSQSLAKTFAKFQNIEIDNILKLLSNEWGKIVTINNFLYIIFWPKLYEYKTRSRVVTWHNNYFSLAKRL